MSRDDIDSDSESFKSFDEPQDRISSVNDAHTQPSNGSSKQPKAERFTQEEETRLLSQSHDEKTIGNGLFGKGSYENAVQTYDRALSFCPNYLDYELAVLRSNIAACHLKLSDWKQAIDSAIKGIDCLDHLEPLPELPRADPQNGDMKAEVKTDVIEEVNEDVEQRIENLRQSGHTIQEVRALQTKLLLRRAKARASQGTWADLQGADEDYRILLLPSMQTFLGSTDRRAVLEAQRKLTPQLNAAREREMGEMMDKLKGLGNSLLKPFGMSTDNFQFIKDEKTGGYSMNFNQNAGK